MYLAILRHTRPMLLTACLGISSMARADEPCTGFFDGPRRLTAQCITDLYLQILSFPRAVAIISPENAEVPYIQLFHFEGSSGLDAVGPTYYPELSRSVTAQLLEMGFHTPDSSGNFQIQFGPVAAAAGSWSQFTLRALAAYGMRQKDMVWIEVFEAFLPE